MTLCSSAAFTTAVTKALGIKAPVYHLVIEARVGDVVRVYVSLYGTRDLIEVTEGLDGAEVTILGGADEVADA